jgi:hypothetical protein
MSDERIGAALTEIFVAVDPVPPAALAAAMDAFGWRDLDLQLAALTFETAADQLLAHTRGLAPRLLTFTCAEIAIDVEVGSDDDGVRLLGQIDPPSSAEVTAEADGLEATRRADARGRFQFDGLPSRRMRLVVSLGGRRVATEWFHS